MSWRRSISYVTVMSAVLSIMLAACGDGVTVDTAPETMALESSVPGTTVAVSTTVALDEIGWALVLAEFTEAAVENGGFLARGALVGVEKSTRDVKSPRQQERAFSLRYRVDEVLWAPVDRSVAAEFSIEDSILPERVEWLEGTIGYPIPGLILRLTGPDAEFPAVYFSPDDGAAFSPERVSGEPFELALMVDAGLGEPLPRPGPVDPCSPPPTDYAATAEELLVAYIQDAVEQTDKTVAPDAEALAEGIAAQHEPIIDTVTGETVFPNTSAIAAQIEAGVPLDEVVIPVTVNMGQETASYEGLAQVGVMATSEGVFLESFPILADGSGNETFYMMDIQAPPPGEGLLIFLREAPPAHPQCVDWRLEEPDIAIPYDEVAGSSRAEVHLATRSYRTLRTLEY